VAPGCCTRSTSYGFAQQFEWFKETRGWEAIIVHLIYGLAAVVTHKGLAAVVTHK
jgi:hypothetical protein